MPKPAIRSGMLGCLVAAYLHAHVAAFQGPQASARGAFAQTPMDPKQLHKVEKTLADHEARLMHIPGVVGVGIGLTEQGDQPAIHVYIDRKAAGGTVPATLPKQLNDVPVRVIETDEIRAR